MEKTCKICKITKPITEYYIGGRPYPVRDSRCKDCRKVAIKKYRLENADKVKKYDGERWKNPTRKNAHKMVNAQWRLRNKPAISAASKIHKDYQKRLGLGDFSQEGKKRASELAMVRHNKKYGNDMNYTLALSLRNRLRMALKQNTKVGSTVRDLGCSIPELRVHLERQFQKGMTWDNWGLYGWHIDHKKPLASFDLRDRSQFLMAVNYTNLQPLWAIDNLRKGNRI